MTDREHRLRQRIDQLADERDTCRQDLAQTRHQLELYRKERASLTDRVYRLVKSRDLWRVRATRKK